jgi:hypothetical protein
MVDWIGMALEPGGTAWLVARQGAIRTTAPTTGDKFEKYWQGSQLLSWGPYSLQFHIRSRLVSDTITKVQLYFFYKSLYWKVIYVYFYESNFQNKSIYMIFHISAHLAGQLPSEEKKNLLDSWSHLTCFLWVYGTPSVQSWATINLQTYARYGCILWVF